MAVRISCMMAAGMGGQPAAKPVAPKPVASAPKPAPVNPLNDPGHILSKRSIFYNCGGAAIKADYRALVEAHVKYIREHPGASVVVERNAMSAH